jgi:hypothetical protein
MEAKTKTLTIIGAIIIVSASIWYFLIRKKSIAVPVVVVQPLMTASEPAPATLNVAVKPIDYVDPALAAGSADTNDSSLLIDSAVLNSGSNFNTDLLT